MATFIRIEDVSSKFQPPNNPPTTHPSIFVDNVINSWELKFCLFYGYELSPFAGIW
jgi:hypothetical protein